MCSRTTSEFQAESALTASLTPHQLSPNLSLEENEQNLFSWTSRVFKQLSVLDSVSPRDEDENVANVQV